MIHFRAIFSRELRGYFDSPIAYIFLVVFLLVNCGLFISSFFLIGQAEMRSFFGLLPIVLVVFIPSLTMRLWAEERKHGSIELLLTLPMPTWKLTLGKYLAAYLFFAIAILCSWPIPVLLFLFGHPDPGPILGGYTGSLLLGGFFLSVGIFVSGLFRDQIVAFIVGTVICFIFFMVGIPLITIQLDGWTGVISLGTMLDRYVGVTTHFDSIHKGVLDIKSIIYFVGMTTLFLLLNSWFMETRLRRYAKIKASIYGSIVFALVIFANVVCSRMESGRFDMTEEKLFTVSDAAKRVLKSLKTPVIVKYFVTPQEKMPSSMKNLERNVRDKLEEFMIASKGNLIYKIYNPDGEGTLEKKMQNANIHPFQVESFERDEISVKLIYSAFSISYLDRKEAIIPAIRPQSLGTLEYELMSKVYKVSSKRKPKIAVYTTPRKVPEGVEQLYLQLGKKVPQPKQLFENFVELLKREEYDVHTVEFSEESSIPENTDTLLILRPVRLNERQRYEINRFVQMGGNLIIAVQTYEHEYSQMGRDGVKILPRRLNPQINPLLSAYGVTVENTFLMDESHELIMIPQNEKRAGVMQEGFDVPVKSPIQIMITSKTMNRDVSITNHIAGLMYLWGSGLAIDQTILAENDIDLKVLARTSDQTWSVDYHSGPLSEKDMRPVKGHQTGKPVAILMSGFFPDPFEGKKRPMWPDSNNGKTTEKTKDGSFSGDMQKKRARIIVVGGSKMFEDELLGAAGNGLLLLNSVDALSLGDNIIHLRGKIERSRLIPKLSSLEKFWGRLFVVFLMPAVIALVGIIRFVLRKRKKDAYQRKVCCT